MMKNKNSCSVDCLLEALPETSCRIALNPGRNTGAFFLDSSTLILPLTKEVRGPDSLLGTYPLRHYDCLARLKASPIPGVLPVTGLCSCSYSVPLLPGNVLFDADSICTALPRIQKEILSGRHPMLLWDRYAKWMHQLALGLSGLHRLGLAHGDVTSFNIMVSPEDDACWIDLETLNDSPEQMVLDIVAFLTSVLLFSLENAQSIPSDFFSVLKKITETLPQEEILPHLADYFSRPPQHLSSLDPRSVRMEKLRFCSEWNLHERNDSFGISAAHYLIRKSLYFQQEFLWLVNYHKKTMHAELMSEQTIHSAVADVLVREKPALAEVESPRVERDSFEALKKEHKTAVESLVEKSREISLLLESLERGKEELSASIRKQASLEQDLESCRAALAASKNELELARSDAAMLQADLEKCDAERDACLDLLRLLKTLLYELSGHFSFRAAKVLQILRNPEIIGEDGRLKSLYRLLTSRFQKRPFADDYLALTPVLLPLQDGLRQLEKKRTRDKKGHPSMTDGPLVTVVLPVYNHAGFLKGAVESVRNQRYRNWELIVVNDGSSDHPETVMEEFRSDRRIIFLSQKNQKLPKALSNGFSFASGKYLTWTSADNLMHPDQLSRMVAFLESRPEVSMVYSDYSVIGTDGRPFTETWFRPQNKLFPESPDIHVPRTPLRINEEKDNFIGASFMYRRNALRILGDYDPQLGIEDYDYWMRMNDLLRIAHIGTDEVLYFYRVHENSLSGHALEHRILQKSFTLMDYESARRNMYFLPFRVYGSWQTSDLNWERYPVPELCAPASGTLPQGKNILLLKASELMDFSIEELKKYDFAAAYFYEHEENYAGACSWKIRAANLYCFTAADTDVEKRLELFTSNVLTCSPADFGWMALSAANNHLFFHATRSLEETRRILPESEPHAFSVLMLVESFGTGGLEKVVLDMAEVFIGKGHRVVLAGYAGSSVVPKPPEGVDFVELSESGDAEGALAALLDQRKIDFVLAHYTLHGAALCRERKIPFAQVIHNCYVWFSEEQCRAFREQDPETSVYFAVSANAAWYAAERIGLPEEKMVILENGVSPCRPAVSGAPRSELRRRFRIPEDAFVFVNSASCYAPKGQLNLIPAFLKALAQNPDLYLILAGRMMEEDYGMRIRKMIAASGKADRIRFGEYFDGMENLLACSDALVMPSFWEGCSLAVAEAVSAGLPVLSTRTGDAERQTSRNPRSILIDLHLRFLTDLRAENCGSMLYTENPGLVHSFAEGMLRLASNPAPFTPDNVFSREVAYGRTLKFMHYFRSGLSTPAIRHNLRESVE